MLFSPPLTQCRRTQVEVHLTDNPADLDVITAYNQGGGEGHQYNRRLLENAVKIPKPDWVREENDMASPSA